MRYLILDPQAGDAEAETISSALWDLTRHNSDGTTRWVSWRTETNPETGAEQILMRMPSDELRVSEALTEQDAKAFVDLFRTHISEAAATEMEQLVLDLRGQKVSPPDVLVPEIKEALYEEAVLKAAGWIPEPEDEFI